MTTRSPFRPTFGVNPPSLAGRASTLDSITDALDEGVGSPGRTSLVTGARGIGKTIVLNEAEDAARARGWIVISETLSPGLLDRLTDEHLPEIWRVLGGEAAPSPAAPRTTRRWSGVTLPAGLGGVSFTTEVERLRGLRPNLVEIAGLLAARGGGVLVTLDEIHRASGRQREDLQTLVATIQHLWREEHAIAFVGAGLPAAVQDVLTDDVLTFLRRAQRLSLGLLEPDDAADALREPMLAAGRNIDDAALERAVALAQGYPYLVQIIGDLAWRIAPDGEAINEGHVASIADRAVRTLGQQVHQPAVADLSERDRDFLRAMLPDTGSTAIRDLLTRLDVGHPYASRYRRRLISSGLVRADGRGRMAFALPYLRDYLESVPD